MEERAAGRTRVIDPFAGSGTVLLESEACGVESIGIDAHPFVVRVARAKLHWRENPSSFRDYSLGILASAQTEAEVPEQCAPLLLRCFPPPTLTRLFSLRAAWEKLDDGSPLSELAWLALVSILRECSPVGTAQWQYVLPNKAKGRSLDPYQAFFAKVHRMTEDMAFRQRQAPGLAAVYDWGDARVCDSVPDQWADLVITSPPYANNYDYADATRLEMSFMGEVRGWGDLQETVRRYLVRSCTQHVSGRNGDSGSPLLEPLLDPIRAEITAVYAELAAERENHGGKKRYHSMIAAYFSDLAGVWRALRRVCVPGAKACFVIGDSAPYGVYVPVDRWLGELAVSAGFKSYSFEKLRDRNIKWKNRKHRVPLHEGRLWVEG